MKYECSNPELLQVFGRAEQELLFSGKLKFERTHTWRKENLPNYPGIYALFETPKHLLYIGETGSLRERMKDVCRTVNHTFRREYAKRKFGSIKSSKKFSSDVELQLDRFFDEKLYIAFLKVNFGRTEIETHLVSKYQSTLMNLKKREN